MTTTSTTSTLKYDNGTVQFRQRLAVSLLSRRSVLIRNIRPLDISSPGLADHEVSFLRLLDSLTNGTRIEINATGTQVRFTPGMIIGGSRVHHICPNSRGVGWFLEGIFPLAAFGKEALSLTLEGVTDGTCEMDPSPDYLKRAAIPLLQRFGIGDDAEESSAPSIVVKKHGAPPLGGGLVEFYCPMVKKELRPIDLSQDQDKIKRIRGLCVSCNIPPSSAARASHSAKGVLLRLLPDVWIHASTLLKGKGECGPSPSLSLLLSAETVSGSVLCAEACLNAGTRELPEDFGRRAAALLLREVQRGGCIDTGMQSLALLLMCLAPEDVVRIRVGTLSQFAIESLRLFKQAFGVEFKLKPHQESHTVLLSCLGTGFTNMAKKST